MEADSDKQCSNAIALSALLNITDDVSAQENRLLIMTTNAIEQLDNAFVCPGRVDMKVHHGYADSA